MPTGVAETSYDLMKQLTLSEIWVYPVKSLGGIRLTSAKVFQKGLQFDRRWMLVDEKGVFLTQRIHPKMALFKLALNGDQLFIQFRHPTPGASTFPSVFLDTTAPPLGGLVKAIIWNDEVEVQETDPAISAWFSDLLDLNVRLVAFPERNPRPVDPQYQINNEHVSLADAYPFLIIGESSLNDLNERLTDAVPMNRFRPNFVFTGGKPYDEDDWKEFSIGGNRFAGVKPCARCNLTTVNQDTAHRGVEPLLTLSSYRKSGNKVLFGQNVVALDHSIVSVGDEITLH
jgi:uncharacterized protein